MTKFASNNSDFLKHIPPEHRGKNVKQLDIDRDSLPAERALGMKWCVETDTFSFDPGMKVKPATRRGILGTVSGIF